MSLCSIHPLYHYVTDYALSSVVLLVLRVSLCVLYQLQSNLSQHDLWSTLYPSQYDSSASLSSICVWQWLVSYNPVHHCVCLVIHFAALSVCVCIMIYELLSIHQCWLCSCIYSTFSVCALLATLYPSICWLCPTHYPNPNPHYTINWSIYLYHSPLCVVLFSWIAQTQCVCVFYSHSLVSYYLCVQHFADPPTIVC